MYRSSNAKGRAVTAAPVVPLRVAMTAAQAIWNKLGSDTLESVVSGREKKVVLSSVPALHSVLSSCPTRCTNGTAGQDSFVLQECTSGI